MVTLQTTTFHKTHQKVLERKLGVYKRLRSPNKKAMKN